MTHISDFIAFMERHNCAPSNPSDITAEGKWTDYKISGDKNGKKKGFYTLRIDGDYASGACGDRRRGEVYQWRGRPEKQLTDQERREFARKRAAEEKAAAAAESERHEKCAISARQRWQKAKAGHHAYLKRKGITGQFTRVDGDMLLIPMYADGKMWGVQTIDEDGCKLFKAGGRKKGCFCPLTTADESKALIAIAEGYATAASVREATGWPTVAAFDAGNLKPVAEALRKKYQQAEIVICGDCDESETGQKKATEAAQAVGGFAIWPDTVGKDFNDLAQERGIEYIKNQIAELYESAVNAAARGGDEVPCFVLDVVSCSSPPPYMEQIPDEAYEESNGIDWRQTLLLDAKDRPIKNSIHNAIKILLHAPDFCGVFKFNAFQSETYVVSCPPWENEADFEPHRVNDNDITQTAAFLERHGLSGNVSVTYNAIRVVAEKRKFHPAQDYFKSVKWDGVKRLDGWLATYLGANEDDAAYLSFIGKKWLTAGVKRIFHAGCKFDHILVLEGKQGAGKSTALQYLATFGGDVEKAYFSDNIRISDIQNKDTIMLLQGSIIVELAELAGFRKKEDDEIKGWITVKEDRCRLPYGRTVTHFPRQFILSASTNTYDYLKDATGNRRYWPVKVGKIDLDGIKRDREQLWAEAYHEFLGGLHIGPTPEETALAEKAQSRRLSSDVWEDTVMDIVRGLGFRFNRNGFKTKTIMTEMGIQVKEQDGRATRRIADILRKNGYESKTARTVDGGIERLWKKTEDEQDQHPDEDIEF